MKTNLAWVRDFAKWSCFLLVAMMLSVVSASGQSTLSVRADFWYPYNGEPASNTPGFVVEVLKKVFEKDGGKLDYQIMPWKRAVAEAEAGSICGVIGALRSDTPTFVFPEEPIGISVNAVYVKKGAEFKYSGVDSLKGKKLGTISGYSYGDEVDAYLKQNGANAQLVNESTGDAPDEQALRKVKAGRVDVYIGDRTVTTSQLAKLGLTGEIVECGVSGQPEPMYITFSPKRSDSKANAEKLTAGIRELRKSGELAQILKKYGLKDWAE